MSLDVYLEAVRPTEVYWHNQLKGRAGTSSGLLGVTWDRAFGKWRAQIVVSGKVLYIGSFDDKLSAHSAYLAKKQMLHLLGHASVKV